MSLSQSTSIQSGEPKSVLPPKPNAAQKSARTEVVVALTIIQLLYLVSLVVASGFIALMGMACDMRLQDPECVNNAQRVINITIVYQFATIVCSIAAWITVGMRREKLAFLFMLGPILGAILAAIMIL